MNGLHLLEAMGLLDDDLIQEAEEYRRPQSKRRYSAWLGWAACFAVVLVLGYGLTHLGLGGGNSMAPAGGTDSNETSGGAEVLPNPGDGIASNEAGVPTAPGSAESVLGAAGDASPDLRAEVLGVYLQMDEPMNRLSYGFYHWYGEDRTLNELPEGCVSLGKIQRSSAEELPNVPYTDSEEYVGCEAWLLREDPVRKEYTLYVALPEGGYLECRNH